jgi:hypothetical protein
MSTNVPLGTLTEDDVRKAWPHEALNFTPWLCENLEALSKVIGIPMEKTGSEVPVTGFAADILARNPQDDSLVLIENQLATTDHTHLGQILTYLAGLEAQTVIWVATSFHEAHLSAVNWLNEHTDDPFSFFAVRVKVVRIGDSPLAPVFEVLARPSHWERQLQLTVKPASDLALFRKEFWEHFVARYPDAAQDAVVGAASNRWRPVPSLGVVVSYYVGKQYAGIFVRGPKGVPAEDVYAVLAPHAPRLSERLGASIGQPDYNYYFGRSKWADTSDRTRWDELCDWLHEQIGVFTTALQEIGEEVASEA